MENNLITSIEETTSQLMQAIDSFSQKQFNLVPFEGSWTGGQVAEHLLKSESGIQQVLAGNTQPTNRLPNKFAAEIEKTFLDFKTKMQSPPDIIPSDEPKEKQALLIALQANRTEIKRQATHIDLTKTFTDFPLPNMGALTGIEWLTFLISHSKRHIHQLVNINKKLN